MKRTRRHGRFWHIGILFLVYSCLHVYSATIGGPSSTSSSAYTERDDDKVDEVNAFTYNPNYNIDLLVTTDKYEVLLRKLF